MLTIITPTLLRETLIQACHSVDTQVYERWQHLVMVDCAPNAIDLRLLTSLAHPQRFFILHNMSGPSGYPASKLRHRAWELARGEYLLYLDDDDYYLDELALSRIKDGMSQQKDRLWGMFPIRRLGKRFYHPNAIAMYQVCGGQIVHRRTWQDQPVRWPAFNHTMDDWTMISRLKAIEPPVMIDGPAMVAVDRIGGGG